MQAKTKAGGGEESKGKEMRNIRREDIVHGVPRPRRNKPRRGEKSERRMNERREHGREAEINPGGEKNDQKRGCRGSHGRGGANPGWERT